MEAKVLNEEQFDLKIKSMSVKLKKLWPSCARIIYFPTYLMLDDMCRRRGSKKCCFQRYVFIEWSLTYDLINEHFTLFGSTAQR